MIKITNPADCCGCEACRQACPKTCISMWRDSEGFRYPVVDSQQCIDCGKCEHVCPVINQAAQSEPQKVYAAKNADEDVRQRSSSGGIFHLLAKQTIDAGGVVFGARFADDWSVVHDYSETLDGLSRFMGSKYLQSEIGDTFAQAATFLKDGRRVLYSGTPCQIAGLRRFLGRDYPQLLCIDIVCHGVPSPAVWQQYLELLRETGKNTEEQRNMTSVITDVEFRRKYPSWKKYGFAARIATSSPMPSSVANIQAGKNSVTDIVEPFFENTFMQGFLANIYLRPSCYACPAKGGKSGADITLGDFWGIESIAPDFDDDRGTSLVLVNTDRGAEALKSVDAVLQQHTYAEALQGNPSIVSSVGIPRSRKFFFSKFGKENDLEQLINRALSVKPPFIIRAFGFAKRKIKQILKR